MFRVEKLSPIPAGENPFLHDAYNMGRYIGKNLLLMQGNHDNEECKYIILVNQKTGERVRLIFEDRSEGEKAAEGFVNAINSGQLAKTDKEGTHALVRTLCGCYARPA